MRPRSLVASEDSRLATAIDINNDLSIDGMFQTFVIRFNANYRYQ